MLAGSGLAGDAGSLDQSSIVDPKFKLPLRTVYTGQVEGLRTKNPVRPSSTRPLHSLFPTALRALPLLLLPSSSIPAPGPVTSSVSDAGQMRWIRCSDTELRESLLYSVHAL